MNMEQQQQQQQQYSIVPPPPSSTCITTTMASSLNSSGEYVNVPTSYVTIGMMPPPTQAAPTPTSMAMAVGSGQNISSTGSSTSTFKTPLLPMPTLEDIEVGLCNSSSNSNMPPGILKYTTTATTSLNMPPPPALGMGPGPPNLNQMSSMSSPPQPTPPSVLNLPALVSQQHNMSVVTPPPPNNNLSLSSNSTMGDGSSTCGTLKSSAKLQQQQQQQTPANLNATTTSNIAAGAIASVVANNCNNININNTTSNSSSTVPLNLHSTTANSSKTSSRSNLHNRPASPKCCSCFGGGGSGSSSTNNHTRGRNTNKSSSSISTKSQGYAQTKGRRHSRHNAQTFWSAVLTNLGICALLLAYTLLGSFIFLTIESEDSAYLQQQRTLASTKRNIQPHKQHTGTTGSGVAGSSSSSSSSGTSGSADGSALAGTTNNNIYQTQQQQHTPPLHYDNGTINAAGSSATSSSSSSSASSPQMIEGMISLQNNDFSYGDDFTPQYALSPDTYDVRQRTIENIWDITVSLNILYKENWTKLAALEIAKFQDQLIKRLNEDALLQLPHEADVNGQTPATEAVLLFHQHGLTPHHAHHHHHHEWNFARAFLYSLTVLTTIGYGNIAPRTTLGRLVTLAYAFFGIPLTLVYLSSTGGILAKVAREVFSKALCCCLCSNCGYCCYDEKRMAEKERRMKRKRQQEELRKQQQAMQEPYYVRSGSMPDNFQTPEKQSLGNNSIQMPDLDSLSASESRGSMHGLAILAPILLCFSMMIIYILFGAVVLYRLEEWPLLDGIYFCFMSLSTIGFGDMMPGFRHDSNTTIWFCSIYIMSGMALTAMCFNVIHEEIVNRIKIVVEFKKSTAMDTTNEEANYYMPP
ncbi:hypothetical protein FF38_04786 [Lucilia cuprina]|uniref:Potassium channel domain-containing protein n=1 Tax=Lucilia cuprina TaxID=7375 RepID=A0A0L0BTQ8_LUCCU|nr:hypothetical protein FF38_04786 [Lucilia cuprina]